MGLKLELELVPHSSWGVSLANLLPREEWDKVRKRSYEEAGYSCQICGVAGVKLNAHEVWDYNIKTKTQILRGIECLCEACHEVKHMGRARKVHSKTRVEELIRHWMEINGKSKSEFLAYERRVYEEYKRRNNIVFEVRVGKYKLEGV